MMGCEHIANIIKLEGAEVAAIADPVERSIGWGREIAERDLPVFKDSKTMIKEVELDGVIVCTPNYTHTEVLDTVFETDLHILCEKPLATTFDDVQRTVEKAEKHKGLFWVGMEYRYMPPVTRFIEEAHAGTAGELKMFSIRENRMPFLKKVGDWNRHSENTGGTLVEKSCHYFDMMRHVVGSEPRRVFASGGQDVNHLDEVYDGRPSDILDNAYVVFEFDNGVRTMHELSMFAEASQDHEEMVAVGDKGKLECKIPTGDVYIGNRATQNVDVVHVHVPEEILALGSHHGATWHQHKAFLNAVESGTEAEISALDGLKAVAMGMAAHKSIEEKRPVDMSEFGL
jgi:predicted dehydrogenase